MMNVLSKLVGGDNGGLTQATLAKLSEHNSFADYLPWISYDPETRLYRNKDNTQGYLWECLPLSFGGQKTQTTLEGLFRAGLPDGTIMQVIMHADDHIVPILEAHRRTVTRNIAIARESTDKWCQFLTTGTRGLKNLSGIPVRNFRMFIALKFPVNDKAKMRGINLNEIYASVTELLKGASLSPTAVTPPVLLDWLRRIFNDEPSLNSFHFNADQKLSDQVILDAVVERQDSTTLRIGSKVVKCITPKVYPNEVDLFQSCQLLGGVWGITSDADQIRSPFITCVNVFFDKKLKSKLHFKCNIVLQQQAVGSLAPSLYNKKEEFVWATSNIEKGDDFVQVSASMWILGNSMAAVTESIEKAKRIWGLAAYQMQDDKGIVLPLFITVLPFGLYNLGNNIESLERDHITSPSAATSILPVQSDFAGCSNPVHIYVGRKGQLCGIDIYHKGAINNNMCCFGSSGGGKSFWGNGFLYGNYKHNVIIRGIDIGGSYKKLVLMLGGKYIDFDDKSNICINPFGAIVKIHEDISVITAVILQMIYSTTNKAPNDIAETVNTLIKNAIMWAYKNNLEEKGVGPDGELTYKCTAGVDHVYQYLHTWPDCAEEGDFHSKSVSFEKAKAIAHELAFNLTEYTTGNRYGKWFNGESNLDIAREEFVILELENLKAQPELFKVVTLQILAALTNDLYLSDRSRKRMIFFDEAWQFLSGDNQLLADVIEGGYRRCRKYGGSFCVVSQDIKDIMQWGRAGQAIMNSSAFKFFLEAPNWDQAKDAKLIEYDPFIMKLLKSVKSNKPKYSEIFMDTPFGIGVVRLVVDDYSYYIYTSDAQEVGEIQQLLNSGMSNDAAIREMITRHRGAHEGTAVSAQESHNASIAT